MNTLEQEREAFETWWNESGDVTNSGPWNPDTHIQHAWDAWVARAALAQPAAPAKAVEAKPCGMCRHSDSWGVPLRAHCENNCHFEHINAPQPAAPVAVQPLTSAARDVLAERQRQISAEGWTPSHDDKHSDGSMALAAACYAAWCAPSRPASEIVSTLWPWTGWAKSWFKPKDSRHNLIRAAALILAELERIDRAKATGSETC